MSQDKKAVDAAIPAVSLLGGLWRKLAFFCTAGFAYPNAMVEGLDPTAIQASTQGDLYAKKIK